MINSLKMWFGLGGKPSEHVCSEASTEATTPIAIEEEIPRYPPFTKGFPMAPVEKVLSTQQDLINRIKGSLGYNEEEFERLVLPVISRYAAFVHLLPASENHHHRGAGGLFRHGLEVAFWATQASESVIFSIEGSPFERRNNEPRWRLATCFAGLLHDVGKPLSDVAITSSDGDVTWNPYSESLVHWAEHLGLQRYFLRWLDRDHKRHEQFSLLTVERILTVQALEYLAEPGKEIVEAMLQAISGLRVDDPVTKLMLEADRQSVGRDLQQNRLDVDEFAYGIPVERYVFDAIRRLIKTGKWNTNEKGSRIWHLHQGVFIVWKQATTDIYNLLAEDKIPGIPRDPDTLADILIERGFAIKNIQPEHGSDAFYRYWEVVPLLPKQKDEKSGVNTSTSIKLQMLRLDSPELVFTTEPPPVIEGIVVGESGPEERPTENKPSPEIVQTPVEAASEPKIVTDIEAVNSQSSEPLSEEFDVPDFMRSDTESNDTPIGHQENADEPISIECPVSEMPNEQNHSADANDALAELKAVGGALGYTGTTLPFCTEQTTQNNAVSNSDTATKKCSKNISKGKKTGRSRKNNSSNTHLAQPPETEVSPAKLADATGVSSIDDWLVTKPDECFSAPVIPHNHEGERVTEQVNAIDTLHHVLSTYDDASSSLMHAAIDPLLDGTQSLGDVLCLIDDKVVLLYPNGASALGVPSDVLNILFNANMICPDEIHNGRKVHDLNGIKCLLFVPQISDVVMDAIRHAELKREEELSSGWNTHAPYQQSPQSRDTDLNFLLGNENAKADSAKGKRAKKGSKQKTKPKKPTVQSEQSKTTTNATSDTAPVQNISRLPKKNSNKKAPIKSPATTSSSSEKTARAIDAGMNLELEFNQIQADQGASNRQDQHDLQGIFPPSSAMGPEEAIATLKEMIKERKGRWLVGPVNEKEGYLYTSGKALELIVNECDKVSKVALRGVIGGAQPLPRIRYLQGNLRMEMEVES